MIFQEFFAKNGWCQESYATDENGINVRPTDERACSFCLLGSIKRIKYKNQEIDDDILYNQVRSAIKQEANCLLISMFNDCKLKSKEELMDFLKKYNL